MHQINRLLERYHPIIITWQARLQSMFELSNTGTELYTAIIHMDHSALLHLSDVLKKRFLNLDQIFNLEKTRREKYGQEISCAHGPWVMKENKAYWQANVLHVCFNFILHLFVSLWSQSPFFSSRSLRICCSSKMSLSSIFLHANTQTCAYTTLALPSSSCLIWASRVSLRCDTSQQIPADVVQWLADPHALLSKLKPSTLHNKTPPTSLLN